MKQSFTVFSEMEFLYFVNFLCWTCRRLSCTVTLKPPQIYQLRFVDISINYSKQNKTKHKSYLLQKFKYLTSETNKQTKTNIQQRKKKNTTKGRRKGELSCTFELHGMKLRKKNVIMRQIMKQTFQMLFSLHWL